MIEALFRHVIAPVGFRAGGSRRLARLAELRASAKLVGRERAEFQAMKLRRLVRHAYDTVPFYRKRFDAAGLAPDAIRTVEDLPLLPTMIRRDAQTAGDALRSQSIPRSKMVLKSTSGSTGQPLHLLFDQDALDWKNAGQLRSFEAAGWRLGKRLAHVAARVPDSGEGRWPIARQWLQRNRRFSILDNEASLQEGLRDLERWNPWLLFGTARRVGQLAELALERKGTTLRPHAVQTSSSVLSANAKRTITEGLGVVPTETYAALETGVAGVACGDGKGFHVQDDQILLEVLRDGEPADPDEEGHVVVTTLNHYGMPLIRYAIGDLGTLGGAACGCGYQTPLLSSLSGRTTDVIPKPSGGRTLGTFESVFRHELLVRQYQIWWDGGVGVRALLVTDPAYSAADEARIRKAFARTDPLFEVTIEYVASIAPGPGGKPQALVRAA